MVFLSKGAGALPRHSHVKLGTKRQSPSNVTGLEVLAKTEKAIKETFPPTVQRVQVTKVEPNNHPTDCAITLMLRFSMSVHCKYILVL